jgi:hypothetical protein
MLMTMFFRPGHGILLSFPGCGFMTRRVMVFRPSSMARTISPLNNIGRSLLMAPLPPAVVDMCILRFSVDSFHIPLFPHTALTSSKTRLP